MTRPASSADTAPEVDAVHFERYARMSPAENARVVDVTRAACTLALAGLRARHPDGDERDLLLRCRTERRRPRRI